MARTGKPAGETGPPRDLPNVLPEIAGAAQARILIDAVKESVSELRSDVKDLKDYRHTDFRWYVTIFGSGFLILAGLTLLVYLRLEDKIQALSTMLTRFEAKMESLSRPSPPSDSSKK